MPQNPNTKTLSNSLSLRVFISIAANTSLSLFLYSYIANTNYIIEAKSHIYVPPVALVHKLGLDQLWMVDFHLTRTGHFP